MGSGKTEKRVVEFYNILRRTVIRTKRHFLSRIDKLLLASCSKLAFRSFVNHWQTDDLLHLAATETVNRLLGVTHNHVHVAESEAILHQRQEILPLKHRSVLKLIDEIMSVLLAYPFVNKRHRAVTQNVGNTLVELRNMHLGSLLYILTDKLKNMASQNVEIQVFFNNSKH